MPCCFKIPMIHESKDRFPDTEKLCLSSSVLVNSHNEMLFQDSLDS